MWGGPRAAAAAAAAVGHHAIAARAAHAVANSLNASTSAISASTSTTSAGEASAAAPLFGSAAANLQQKLPIKIERDSCGGSSVSNVSSASDDNDEVDVESIDINEKLNCSPFSIGNLLKSETKKTKCEATPATFPANMFSPIHHQSPIHQKSKIHPPPGAQLDGVSTPDLHHHHAQLHSLQNGPAGSVFDGSSIFSSMIKMHAQKMERLAGMSMIKKVKIVFLILWWHVFQTRVSQLFGAKTLKNFKNVHPDFEQ
jgi:hypothetical protein